MTPIFLRMPSFGAAVENHGSAGGAGAGGDHAGAEHRDILMRFAKVQQQREPIGFRSFALQLAYLHFQLVVVTAKLLVFTGSVLKREIMIPGVSQAANAMRAGAFKR